MNGLQERLVVERLAQIGGGAGRHALGPGLRFVMAGDDDDGYLQPLSRQVPLNVESVHVGHMQIEDEAVGAA